MCDTCGCNITPGNAHLVRNDGPLARSADGREAITLLKGLLTENDRQATHNREHFDRHGVLAILARFRQDRAAGGDHRGAGR
mgnify:CR=1 FL=1